MITKNKIKLSLSICRTLKSLFYPHLDPVINIVLTMLPVTAKSAKTLILCWQHLTEYCSIKHF